MKRIFLASLASACLVCAVALPSLHAVDVPADGIEMDYYDGGEKNLMTVFNHSTHTDAKCEDCHHVEGDQQYAGCTTEGCHDVMDKKDKSVNSWYMVIHGKQGEKHTCMSCHKEVAGTDKEKKKALLGCKGSACHPQ